MGKLCVALIFLLATAVAHTACGARLVPTGEENNNAFNDQKNFYSYGGVGGISGIGNGGLPFGGVAGGIGAGGNLGGGGGLGGGLGGGSGLGGGAGLGGGGGLPAFGGAGGLGGGGGVGGGVGGGAGNLPLP